MEAIREQGKDGVAVVHVEGPLRAPVDAELRRGVEALLQRGRRQLLVDLARVAEIDAAGVGELVHVYTLAAAADGALHLTHLTSRVQTLLGRAGLLDLLSADAMFCRARCG